MVGTHTWVLGNSTKGIIICDPTFGTGVGWDLCRDWYLFKYPCGVQDWHLVWASTGYPQAYGGSRFTITRPPRPGSPMIIIIDQVMVADSGLYYCTVDKFYSDMYQSISISVMSPQPKNAPELSTQEEQREDDEEVINTFPEWALPDHGPLHPKRTLSLCEGNMACAVAILHKENLEYEPDYWICHHLASRWQTTPLTYAIINVTGPGAFPRIMAQLLTHGHQTRYRQHGRT